MLQALAEDGMHGWIGIGGGRDARVDVSHRGWCWGCKVTGGSEVGDGTRAWRAGGRGQARVGSRWWHLNATGAGAARSRKDWDLMMGLAHGELRVDGRG